MNEENDPIEEPFEPNDEQPESEKHQIEPIDEQSGVIEEPSDQITNSYEPLGEEEEWQAPPLPEEIPAEQKEMPQMSEASTLINIFFEPGRVFEDLRRKPRFIIGFIIIAILSTAFVVAFQNKIGEENMRRFMMQQNEKNPQFESAPPEQKKQAVDIGMAIQKGISYGFPVLLLIIFFIGSLIYWLGIKAMGGTASLWHAISVWVYSSFPPTVIGSIANLITLMIKSPEDIDIATSSRGLVKANPAILLDGKEMPVITTIVSTIDLFVIWGIILAVIGLHKVGKISKGAAFAIVIILTLISLTFRVVQAFFGGNPV